MDWPGVGLHLAVGSFFFRLKGVAKRSSPMFAEAREQSGGGRGGLRAPRRSKREPFRRAGPGRAGSGRRAAPRFPDLV